MPEERRCSPDAYLLAAEGKLDIEIAAQLSISSPKAARWRNRFLASGLEGLKKDAPRPGRTPRIKPDLVRDMIARTTQTRPSNATHWSTRTLAAEMGISDSSVLRIWQAHGLKPHLIETFKISNDPHFGDQFVTRPPGHHTAQLQLVFRLDEFIDQTGGSGEPDPSLLPAGGNAQAAQ
jgi:transposase